VEDPRETEEELADSPKEAGVHSMAANHIAGRVRNLARSAAGRRWLWRDAELEHVKAALAMVLQRMVFGRSSERPRPEVAGHLTSW